VGTGHQTHFGEFQFQMVAFGEASAAKDNGEILFADLNHAIALFTITVLQVRNSTYLAVHCEIR